MDTDSENRRYQTGGGSRRSITPLSDPLEIQAELAKNRPTIQHPMSLNADERLSEEKPSEDFTNSDAFKLERRYSGITRYSSSPILLGLSLFGIFSGQKKAGNVRHDVDAETEAKHFQKIYGGNLIILALMCLFMMAGAWDDNFNKALSAGWQFTKDFDFEKVLPHSGILSLFLLACFMIPTGLGIILRMRWAQLVLPWVSLPVIASLLVTLGPSIIPAVLVLIIFSFGGGLLFVVLVFASLWFYIKGLARIYTMGSSSTKTEKH